MPAPAPIVFQETRGCPGRTWLGRTAGLCLTCWHQGRGGGAELKASYYRQAVKNVQLAAAGRKDVFESQALDFGGDGDAEQPEQAEAA